MNYVLRFFKNENTSVGLEVLVKDARVFLRGGLGSSLFAPFFSQMGFFPNVSGAGLNIIDIWSVDAIRVSGSKCDVSRMNIAHKGESTSVGAGSSVHKCSHNLARVNRHPPMQQLAVLSMGWAASFDPASISRLFFLF